MIFKDCISSSYTPLTEAAHDKSNSNQILEIDCFDPQINNLDVTSASLQQQQQQQQSQIQQLQSQLSQQQSLSNLPSSSILTSSSTAPPLNGTTSELYQKAKLLSVNTKYKNHLYVYPKSLKYDMQRTFTKVA